MTVNTPPHREILHLPDAIHRLDRAVTMLALHAGIHMSLVVEARISGKIVHFDPRHRVCRSGRVWLQLSVQSQAVIQLLHFRGHDPLRRLVRPQGFHVLVKRRVPIRRHEAVAIHAETGRGETGMLAFLSPEMAIQAGNLQLTSVHPVGECNWLLGSIPLLVTRERVARESGDHFE